MRLEAQKLCMEWGVPEPITEGPKQSPAVSFSAEAHSPFKSSDIQHYLNSHGLPASTCSICSVTELLLEPESPPSASDRSGDLLVYPSLLPFFLRIPTYYPWVISRLHCWHTKSLLLNEPYKSYLKYSWTRSPWETCLSTVLRRITVHVLLPPLDCQLVIYFSNPLLMPLGWDLFTCFWRDVLSKALLKSR